MILQVVIGLAMIITGMGYDLLIWGNCYRDYCRNYYESYEI